MFHRISKFWHYFLVATIIDVVVIILSLFVVVNPGVDFTIAAGLITFCWVLSNILIFPSTNQRYISFIHTYYRTAKLFVLFAIFYRVLLAILYDDWQINISFIKFIVILFSLTILSKTVFVYFIRLYRNMGFGRSQYMILAYPREAVYFRRVLKKNTHGGYKFCCAVDEDHPLIQESKIENFSRTLKDHLANEIYVYPTNKKETFEFIQEVAKKVKANIFLIPIDTAKHIQFYNFRMITKSSYEEIINGPLIRRINRWAKRLFDIIFSSIVIVLILSWLLPLIGLLIVLENKGGVFFMQSRNGRDKKQFKCFKLRSMRKNENAHSSQAIKKDPRITKVGAFIRKTSLDELPQFLNVFLGDMSVIGPRPHPVLLDGKFEKKIKDYDVRFTVKPGITGLSQAYGYRGETQKTKDMEIRIKTDVVYIQNWTMLLDFRIVFKTIRTAFLTNNETAY